MRKRRHESCRGRCCAAALFLGFLWSVAAARAETPPPTVSIVSAKPGPSGTLRIEVEVMSPSGDPIQLRPWLNGQPLPEAAIGQASAAAGPARGLALAQHYTLSIPKPSQESVLSVLAQAGAVASEPAAVRLTAQGLDLRSVLYLLAVGVGQYQRPEIPALRYPAKDARDLVATMAGQKRQIYRAVQTQLLVDSEATRQRILSGLDWLKKNTKKEDTAVVFLAGHGTNDTDGSYYFLPFEARADNRSMLSGAELQQALRDIAGRVVLMLDTCHSGNVLGRDSYNRLINELTSANRIVVFAASTGDQTARESPAWQNGAFTKAVIEGLRGVADYADNGQITVSEMETWANVRVRQLTGDAQTPTLAKPNAAPDYVLSALPIKGALLSAKQGQRRWILGGSLAAIAAVAIVVGVSVFVVGKKEDNVLSPMFQ